MLHLTCVVSALGSESDNPGSSPGRGKVLCPWDVRGKKIRAPLLVLAKSIYYQSLLAVFCVLIQCGVLQSGAQCLAQCSPAESSEVRFRVVRCCPLEWSAIQKRPHSSLIQCIQVNSSPIQTSHISPMKFLQILSWGGFS